MHSPGSSISVVTPWHNHVELAPAYFTALEHGRPDEVIVVDDASEPALPFASLRLRSKQGFQRACNQGLRAARSDAVLFLNNDVAMTGAGWLDAIRCKLRPGVLVGAQLHEKEGHTEVDGRAEPYLDGWCVAGMRADLKRIGGWDESLVEPAYFGDNLLSLRARMAGMELVETGVGLRHLRGVTTAEFALRGRHAFDLNFATYQVAVRDARATGAAVSD